MDTSTFLEYVGGGVGDRQEAFNPERDSAAHGPRESISQSHISSVSHQQLLLYT